VARSLPLDVIGTVKKRRVTRMDLLSWTGEEQSFSDKWERCMEATIKELAVPKLTLIPFPSSERQ